MKRFPLYLPIILSLAAPVHAATTHHKDATSRLETWETEVDGAGLRLTQISPDQAVAFFLARGFPDDAAGHYAKACVFMTVIRNSAAGTMEFDLSTWTVQPAGAAPQKMKVKEDWLKEWEQRGIEKRARIGFEWSQFPTRQSFQPGDWNQGMTTYLLPRDTPFDVHFNWRRDGKQHSARLTGARCAQPDRVRQ